MIPDNHDRARDTVIWFRWRGYSPERIAEIMGFDIDFVANTIINTRSIRLEREGDQNATIVWREENRS